MFICYGGVISVEVTVFLVKMRMLWWLGAHLELHPQQVLRYIRILKNGRRNSMGWTLGGGNRRCCIMRPLWVWWDSWHMIHLSRDLETSMSTSIDIIFWTVWQIHCTMNTVKYYLQRSYGRLSTESTNLTMPVGGFVWKGPKWDLMVEFPRNENFKKNILTLRRWITSRQTVGCRKRRNSQRTDLWMITSTCQLLFWKWTWLIQIWENHG